MIRSRALLRLTGIAALLSVVLTSCGPDAVSTAPQAPAQEIAPPTGELWLLKGLLSCSTQPYDSTTVRIGAAGGTIEVGRHRLIVPRGALTRQVSITAVAPRDAYASVTFEPHGLVFQKSPRLVLDYSHCPAGRLNLLKRVAYTTDRLVILELLKSWDNLLTMQVSTDIDHFSRYAVAW